MKDFIAHCTQWNCKEEVFSAQLWYAKSLCLEENRYRMEIWKKEDGKGRRASLAIHKKIYTRMRWNKRLFTLIENHGLFCLQVYLLWEKKGKFLCQTISFLLPFHC